MFLLVLFRKKWFMKTSCFLKEILDFLFLTFYFILIFEKIGK